MLTPIQFPTAVASSQIILSDLNYPLMPALPHNVPELLGMDAAKPVPTPLGFEASLEPHECDEKKRKNKAKSGKGARKSKRRVSKSGKDQKEKDDTSSGSSSTSSDDDSDTTSSNSSSSSDKEDSAALDSDSSTDVPSGKKDKEKEKEKGKQEKKNRPMPKSIRDVELALFANWRHVSTETEAFIGKPRHQLENRTGMEVGVMTL